MIGKQALVTEVIKRVKNSPESKGDKRTEEVVEKLLSSIGDFLSSGEKVALQGLFSISVVDKAERRCKNPKTGEEMIIPKKKAFSFKASSNLKKKINE